MAVFWLWRLPPLPLWSLIYNYIPSWRLVRVWNLWHWEVTGGKPMFLHIISLTLALVGCPMVSSILIVTFPWHGDQIQQLIAPHVLDQS